jgi:PAS domain S-box-containing protein
MDFAEGLLESSAAWIWQTDADLKLSYTNSFVTSCLGYQPDEFLHLDMMDQIHPDDHDLVRSIVNDASSTKQSWSGKVLRWRRKDGSWRHIETSGSPLFDASGAFIGLLGIDRDVTERVEADAAHRASIELLRRSQEIAHIGSWELDVGRGIVTWSDEVYRILGLDPQQIDPTNDTFFEAIHPDDRSNVDEGYYGSMREGRDGYEVEYRIIKTDGEERVIHDKCEHLRDESGEVVRSIGMMHDITERIRAEETTVQKTRDLSILLETGNAFTRTLDLDTLLQTIVEQAITLTELDTGALYLLREDDCYLGATTPPLPENFPEELRQSVLVDHPYIGEVIASRRPVILADSRTAELTAAERAVVEARGLRSIIFSPLLVEQRVLGVLILGTTGEVRPFSEAEIDLYTTLSNQAALAIENARLYTAVQQELAEREQAVSALKESEKRFSTVFNSNPIATAITRLSDNKIIIVNESWNNMTGYSQEESVGRTAKELKLWLDPALRDQAIDSFEEKGNVLTDMQVRKKTGEIRKRG